MNAAASSGLRLEGVSKRYDGRSVLDDVSLVIAPGKVHALVGENGAGKTTLIRVACGLVVADGGGVSVGGRELPAGDARAAIAAGVGVVHQHFMLVEPLTVADNVALGHEPRWDAFGLLVDRGRM